MRVNHLAAAGDVADQQDHEDAVENYRSRRGLRAEIEKAVDEINGVTGNEHSPAAVVCRMAIDDGNKTKRKLHANGQSPGAMSRSAAIHAPTQAIIL